MSSRFWTDSPEKSSTRAPACARSACTAAPGRAVQINLTHDGRSAASASMLAILSPCPSSHSHARSSPSIKITSRRPLRLAPLNCIVGQQRLLNKLPECFARAPRTDRNVTAGAPASARSSSRFRAAIAGAAPATHSQRQRVAVAEQRLKLFRQRVTER